MNEAPAPRREHGGQERTRDQERSAQIHGDDLVPFGGSRLVDELAAAHDARVVDDDARHTQRREDRGGGPRDVDLRGDVAGEGQRRGAVRGARGDLGGGALEALAGVAEERDGEAATRERVRRSEADAARRAGDDRDVAQASLP